VYPGVEILGSSATGTLIEGNYVGTDISGTKALGNYSSGIAIERGADNTTIGGTAAGAGNVISANGNTGALKSGYGFASGINLYPNGAPVTGTLIEGNKIGTDVSGTRPLGNLLDGIHAQDGASYNTIGGTAAGAGNTIAFNEA